MVQVPVAALVVATTGPGAPVAVPLVPPVVASDWAVTLAPPAASVVVSPREPGAGRG